MTNTLLPLIRLELPGFRAIEDFLVRCGAACSLQPAACSLQPYVREPATVREGACNRT